MTLPRHVPNPDLTLAGIPVPDAAWEEIRQFAYTWHAYDYPEATPNLARLANSHTARSLTEARACLFFEYRRQVHSPEAADNPDRQQWIRELVARIRSFVAAGRMD